MALASMGVRHDVRLRPRPTDPDLIAIIETRGDPGEHDEVAKSLVAAACARTTNWGDFYELPVNQADLARLIGCVPEGVGVCASVVADEQRWSVDTLVESAHNEQLADPHFVEELSRWPVGRPGHLKDEFAVRLAAAGTLILLSTPTDEAKDWVATGQTLARLILTATGLGLGTTFMNQAVQVESTRTQLATAVDAVGVPQQLVRFGFAESSGRKTSRRDIEEVLRELPSESETRG